LKRRGAFPPPDITVLATERWRALGCFMAGMTGRFVLDRFGKLVGPVELADRF
jgi:hypothetical protein